MNKQTGKTALLNKLKLIGEGTTLKRKVVVATFALTILLAIGAALLTSLNSILREGADSIETSSRVDLAVNFYERQLEDTSAYIDRLLQDVYDSAHATGAVLQELVTDNGYEGPRVFENAAVVEVRDGRVVPPEGAPSALSELYPTLVEEWADNEAADPSMINILDPVNEFVDDDIVAFGAARLADDLYYICWTPYIQDLEEIQARYGAYQQLNTIEFSFDSAILIVDTSEDDLPILNPSVMVPGLSSLGSVGITRDDLLNLDMPVFEYFGKLFGLTCRETSVPDTMIVLASIMGGTAVHASVISLFIVAVMLIALLTCCGYLLFTQLYVRDKLLDARHSTHYAPEAIRLTTKVALVLCTAILFSTSFFINSVSALYQRASKMDTLLTGLFYGLDNHQQTRSDYAYAAEERWYVDQAKRIASVIAEYPQAASRASLQRVSNQLGCDYVMLFDSTGHESLCSNDYTGFSLGNGQGKDSDDFRRLLRGIPSIYHAPTADPLTGLFDAYVGVTIPTTGGTSSHRVLIFAIPGSSVQAETRLSSFDDMLATITPSDEVCYAVDAQTGTIVYSSVNESVGTSITDEGFSQDCLRDDYMDFVRLPSGRYFVRSAQRDNLVFLYGMKDILALGLVTPLSILTALIFAVIFVVVSAILLFGYTDDVYNAWIKVGAPVNDGQLVEVISPDGKRKRTVDPSHRWSFAPINWKDLVPERKTSAVLIAQLVMLALFVYLTARSGIGTLDEATSELTSYILQGNWMRGFNMFALCAILIVVVVAFLLIEVSKAVLQLLSMLFDSRGETICRLVFSLLKYFFVLGALYFSFGYLGFDARTRLTSLGIVSIALSLGAQTLVSDIIAGVFIVFEGEFQVGDIIDVAGFRGTVLEIGVRSTKLMGRGYNIKIIDNHDIKNVINMTHLSSWYPLEVKIPSSVPVEQVEQLLISELPKIGEAYPDIIMSGPTYKGITSLQTGAMITAVGYSILTECQEENYHKVERTVNREVMRILERAEIPLK